MSRLVDRLGRTGFAALTSLIWALPLASWAGSADLSPIDKTPYPGIALAIGLVMLVIWIVIVTQLGRVPVAQRPRRFDLGQMSRSEKRWTLVIIAFFTGVVAWLNSAATVDWAPLTSAVASGKAGPSVFAAILAALLIALLAGLVASWRKESGAFRQRVGSSLSI